MEVVDTTLFNFPDEVPPEYAKAYSQIAKEMPGWWARLNRQTRRALNRLAKRERWRKFLADRLFLEDRAGNELEAADGELDEANPYAIDEDRKRRGVPTLGYALIAVVVTYLWYQLDSSALLTAKLPLDMTRALAICVVAVQILAAHVNGVVAKRASFSTDPETQLGSWELTAGRVARWGGIFLGLSVAAVRAVTGEWVVGLVFAALELALFAGMSWVAHAHHHGLVGERSGAVRRLWLRQRSTEYGRLRLAKETARARSDLDALSRIARSVCERHDAIKRSAIASWSRRHPGRIPPPFGDPQGFERVRKISEGIALVDLHEPGTPPLLGHQSEQAQEQSGAHEAVRGQRSFQDWEA